MDSTMQRAVRRYMEAGLAPIPIPAGTKRVTRDNWQNERHKVEDIPKQWNNGQNVGVLLGVPSNGLVDIDLDVPEAVAIAGRFLPPTSIFGRDGSPDSHWLYYCEGLDTTDFHDLEGTKIVEVRSTGRQTIFPPSAHPEGGRCRFSDSGLQITRLDQDDLLRACRELATATLIARCLPPIGGRHGFGLPLAGFFLRDGRFDPETAKKIMLAAWDAAGYPSEKDKREAQRDIEGIIRSTGEKIAAGEEVVGGRVLDELVPKLPRKIARYFGWSESRAGEGALREIQINNRHLRDVTEDALAALTESNEPPEVFVRSGSLVRVREDENGIPEIQTMDIGHVRGRLARVADFVRVTERGESKVNPPEVVVKDIMAMSTWPFPALEAVVESPILRPDGSIFDTPGYDSETRLYYRPHAGFESPKIPEHPTDTDIREALELVDEAIGEFPYTDAASAANTLGLMLTPLVRQAIPGPVPLALIDKPQAGTGGSLLAETVSLIGSGRTAEMLGAPRDDEEWRKQITAKLAAGSTMITVDNVEGALFAPSLARALTARTWTDRVLGRSETITVKQRATWMATGNNIQLRGDLPRRCYWIRLDAKQSRPWERTNFRHPDLLSWVDANRSELVRALLTIARAWFAAGKPKAKSVPRLGSFEAWCDTVGGMVAFAGFDKFLGNLGDLYAKADEGNAEWIAFLERWLAVQGEEAVTVKELVKLIREETELKDALPGELAESFDKGEGGFSRKLGKALAKRAGTRFGDDGLCVDAAGEYNRAKRWRVNRNPEPYEFMSFMSFYNPSASNFYANNAKKKEKDTQHGPETNSRNSETHTEADEPEGGWFDDF